MGASSGSSSANLTPEQTKTIDLQNQLLSSLIPTYQGVTKGAQEALDMSKPNILAAAKQGFDQSATSANQLIQPGINALGTASGTLKDIISPDFIKNQLSAAVQPIQEQTRDLRTQQTAMFGGSGNLGSARASLADANLASLDKQRQSQAVAGAISDITGKQIGAATNLGAMGTSAVNQGMASNVAAMNYAGAPQTAYAQFANTVFGVPGAASTPNYANTQGQSSKGFKI